MTKIIGLVAHDTRKQDLIDWARRHRATLLRHQLVCTGTTGRLLGEALGPEATIRALKSGPLGGDQQMGAMIADEKIDILIFLWEPMQPQPHDVDVRALLRLSVVYNVPTASNLATADFFVTSPLFEGAYARKPLDYSAYLNRQLDKI